MTKLEKLQKAKAKVDAKYEAKINKEKAKTAEKVAKAVQSKKVAAKPNVSSF